MATGAAPDSGVDFYSHFRLPAYNSALSSNPSGSVAGQFDPLSGVASYHTEIATELRSRDGARTFELVEPGSAPALAYATALHETIHWWQHAGTTAGAAYGLSLATQAVATGNELRDIGKGVAKPIVLATLAPSELPEDHPAVEVASRWAAIEHGAAFSFAPQLAAYKVQAAPAYFRSLGTSIIALHAETVDAIRRVLRADQIPGIASRDGLAEAHARRATDNARFFVEGELPSLPLGMRELLEGQARISEIQYRHLTGDDLSWSEARAKGLLSGVYGAAFDLFSKQTGLELPESPLDDQVWLFLLLCDIALNPDEGYAFEVEPGSDFLARAHPGIRFIKLCRAVAADKQLVRSMPDLSPEDYRRSTGTLCERLGWRTPEEVHRNVVESFSSIPGFAELSQRFEAGDWGDNSLPFRLYLNQHVRLLTARVEMPHFFCWPANCLLQTSSGTERDARAMGRLLADTGPPFVMSLAKGLSSLAVMMPGVLEDQSLSLATTYFTSLAMNDLIRQWLSKSGDFLLSFAWQRDLAPVQAEDLHSLFEKTFGLTLESVHGGR